MRKAPESIPSKNAQVSETLYHILDTNNTKGLAYSPGRTISYADVQILLPFSGSL